VILFFASFILGFFPHLFFSVPSAGEPTQRYLHGGLLIDFIGQRLSFEGFLVMVGGPISRLRLLSVDVIILCLQLVMLAISSASEEGLEMDRTGGPAALDSAERGEREGRVGNDQGNEDEGMVVNDIGYEHIVLRVGVVETIRSLWNTEARVIQRMRQA
jgi:hypothetical protein